MCIQKYLCLLCKQSVRKLCMWAVFVWCVQNRVHSFLLPTHVVWAYMYIVHYFGYRAYTSFGKQFHLHVYELLVYFI